MRRSLPCIAFLAGAVLAFPLHAQQAASGDAVIVVTGKREQTASAATKTATPIAETPQSISVVDAAEITGLGLQNLNQVLRFVAGVTPEQRGASAEVYDQFKLRGFDAPIYLDGLKLFPSATGYAVPQVDVSRLDRVEIVKGPSSVLYGQSSPGGLVSQLSKLPLDRDAYGSAAATYGTDDLYRLDADVGGRAAAGVAWRLYGSANGADTQQDDGKRRRETVSGAVTLGGAATSLTLLANDSHDPFNGNYGVYPAVGTLIDDPAGRIRTGFYGGEPKDFFRREQAAFSYFYRQALGRDWTLRASGRYQSVKSRLGIVYTSGAPVDADDPAPTLFNRASYSTREQVNAWTFDNQIAGRVRTGPLRHDLLFGVDVQVARTMEDFAFGSATPIDVFNPVYGSMPTPRTPEQVPDPFAGDYRVRQNQKGVYLQDEIAVGGLRLALSGRQDWARASQGEPQKDRKFTYRAGALYVTPVGVSPYVSWSTSFEPQAAILADGSIAKPSLGKQLEAGAKAKVPGTDVLVTAAWFDIDQTDVVVYSPLFVATQAGKVSSRGVELEASASLPYGFGTRVAYSHQKIRDREDAVEARVGKPLLGTGRGNATVHVEWAAPAGPVQGLVVGATGRYVDKVYAGIYFDGVARRTPSYTLLDLLLRYDLGKVDPRLNGVQLAVNAANVLDKRHLSTCYADYGWCWYGNRRTAQATVSYRY